MSEQKQEKSRDYAPIQMRDLMAQMMAGSQYDVTSIRGGQVSNIAVLGNISKQLNPNHPGAFAEMTDMMNEEVKWIHMAVRVRKEGGPFLSQFGTDLPSMELLAGILRTHADAQTQKKLLEKYIDPVVEKEFKAYKSFSKSLSSGS